VVENVGGVTMLEVMAGMTISPRRLDSGRHGSSGWTAVALLLALSSLLPGCGGGPRPRPSAGGPKLLTVPAIERMVQMRTPPSKITAEMQGSGTVYNLTSQQVRDLQAVGTPPAIIGRMQQTHQYAVRRNPRLASTGQYWTQVDNYWYGGLPLGWPAEWVLGAPVVRK
jgi:hypothetical protein